MKCLFAAGVMSVSLLASSEVLAEQYRLSQVANPISQHVSLTLDPFKDDFFGQTKINIEVVKATYKLDINGLDYQITRSQLSGNQSCNMSAKMIDSGIVKLTCEQQIKPGNYELTLDFKAPFNRKSVGLYKTIDAEQAYLFTQFEMSDARRAFPVFDEPSFKIPFQMTITAPSAEKVYSNTPVEKVIKKEGMTTHIFAKTKPISSYLVALAVGQFEEMKVTGMKVPGKIITTKGKIELAQYAAEQMPLVLEALEAYFGVDYPYQKLDTVAVPEFPFGAMENAGLVTYREDILLLDKATASSNSKQRAVSIIAHELAHQWYGNLVTMKWWNDLWLNEAFASWMAAKITHQLHPEFESNLALSKNRAMGIDARLSTKPIRKPIKTEADIMDGLGLAYSKGSAVLSMVEHWIGAEAFKKGIQQYIKDHAFANTEADDLWGALAKASGKNVPAVLASFIEQSSYPLIKVELEGKKLSLSQSRFVSAGAKAPAQEWVVPVAIKFGKGDKVHSKTILLDKPIQTVELDFAPDWLYPDAEAMGYYRWQLSKQRQNQLLKQAKSNLTPRERKELISSADALLNAGFISGGDLLSILGTFVDDTHPQIVSTALKYLQSKKSTFIDDSNQKHWKNFIKQRVSLAVDKYGLTAAESESTEISKLRPTLINLLAFEAEDKKIIKLAKQESLKYIKGSNDVDQYLIGTYLTIAVYFGDKAMLNNVKKEFETTSDPSKRTRLMYAMGYAKPKQLQDEILKYSLTDKLKAPDLSYILSGQSYTKIREDRFIQWVYQNYDKIKNKLPPFAVARIPQFTVSSCDLDSLQKTHAFFGTKTKQTPEFKRTLAKVDESVNNCVKLKKREQASVDKYLSRF